MERLSAQEQEHFRDAFALFDQNGDGEISAAELGEVMRNLGLRPSEQELQDLLHEVDIDNSGTIDLNEFMVMMSHRATAMDTEEELRRAFDAFDRDRSGTITVTELRDTLKALGDNLTDNEVDEIMKTADTDGDKTISFEEFKNIMQEST